MRIGLMADGFMEWNGGIDFLLNVHKCIEASNSVANVVVIVPNDRLKWVAKRTLRVVRQLWRGAAESHGHPNGNPASKTIEAFSTLCGYERVVSAGRTWKSINMIAEDEQLDILLPSFHVLAREVTVPWIGYLYDCQHRYLPEFFSAKERRARDMHFRSMIETGRTVFVNSNAVKKDLVEFYGAETSRVFVLPFYSAAPESWFALNPEIVAKKYDIDNRYFMICNQFWKHKDHATAFKAFASFTERVPSVHLVCTGSTIDYRDSSHFRSLLEFIAERKLESRVKILGLIPKLEQIALMRGAIAVVQPTLFEGGPGGGAVYDAIAVGVPAIVSDIKVNLELEGFGVRFFKAGDSNALLSQLLVTVESNYQQDESNLEQCLRAGRERQVRCGDAIVSAVAGVLNK